MILKIGNTLGINISKRIKKLCIIFPIIVFFRVDDSGSEYHYRKGSFRYLTGGRSGRFRSGKFMLGKFMLGNTITP